VKLLQLRGKDETENDRRSQTRTVRRSSRSVSPEGQDNRFFDGHLFLLYQCTMFHVYIFYSDVVRQLTLMQIMSSMVLLN